MKWKKIVNDNLIEVKYLVDYVCLSCKTDWKPNIQLTNEGKEKTLLLPNEYILF